jgi:hypothetical protein
LRIDSREDSYYHTDFFSQIQIHRERLSPRGNFELSTSESKATELKRAWIQVLAQCLLDIDTQGWRHRIAGIVLKANLVR